jgi:hypothetical protein
MIRPDKIPGENPKPIGARPTPPPAPPAPPSRKEGVGVIKVRSVAGAEFPPMTPAMLQLLADNCFHAQMIHEHPGKDMGPLAMYDEDRQQCWREIARAAWVTLAVESGADFEVIPHEPEG